MSQVTTKLTTAMAALAIASLSIVLGAQGRPTSQPATRPATPPATSQPNRSSTDSTSAQQHLDEAKRALSSVGTVQGDAQRELTELRRHFTQLETAWRNKIASLAKTGAAPTGHASGHTGTASTAGTTSGTAAGTTAGTSGTPEQAGATGPVTSRTPANDNWLTHYQAIDTMLDRLIGETGARGTANTAFNATTRTKLADFRRHLDLFHAAAMSQARVGEEDAASALAQSGVTGSMTGTAGTSGTVHQPSTTDQMTTPAPQTRGDSITASPDASALARLSAQIDELLAGSRSEAVGTSGASAAGTVCVERAKLEQLKRDIQALQADSRR
jgi:hypothetical protein